MTNSQLVEIRRNLVESRRDTIRYIDEIDESAATYRLRPDAWSVKDHIIHLAAVEESVLHFAHRILHEDCPISPLCYDLAYNQDASNRRIVAERAGDSWQTVCNTLAETRQQLLSLIDNISEESLNRVGSHPMWGTPVTLASVLKIPYRHERAHRDEIAVLCDLQHNGNP